eukprot:15021326-Alexandrium_andersonii.AAC.1
MECAPQVRRGRPRTSSRRAAARKCTSLERSEVHSERRTHPSFRASKQPGPGVRASRRSRVVPTPNQP